MKFSKIFQSIKYNEFCPCKENIVKQPVFGHSTYLSYQPLLPPSLASSTPDTYYHASPMASPTASPFISKLTHSSVVHDHLTSADLTASYSVSLARQLRSYLLLGTCLRLFNVYSPNACVFA